jgi:hypothetical protein
VVAPIICAAACAAGRPIPAFAALIGGAGPRRDLLDWVLGGTLIALMLVAVEAALGLVFDPRYRDIPFAPLIGAAAPFLVVLATSRRPAGTRAMAETVAAAMVALSAIYIAVNETVSNWQSLLFCAGLIALGVILQSGRDAPGSE